MGNGPSYVGRSQVDQSWANVVRTGGNFGAAYGTTYSDIVDFWSNIYDVNYDIAIYQIPNLVNLSSYIGTLFDNTILFDSIVNKYTPNGTINKSSIQYLLYDNTKTVKETYSYIYIYAYTLGNGTATQNINTAVENLGKQLAYTEEYKVY